MRQPPKHPARTAPVLKDPATELVVVLLITVLAVAACTGTMLTAWAFLGS